MTGYKHVLESWKRMMTRCYNPNSKDYKNYGERGIKVTERWHNSTNFLNDMKSSWKEGLSLDRIDNNGNYSKENCRWASRLQQNNNTRRNHLFEFRGERKTLTNWAILLGLKRSTIAQRIYVYGWSIDQALTRKRGK